VARDRFTAEDAMNLVEVEYEPLPSVVDHIKAMEEGAPVIHEEVGSNIVWSRTYRFCDPDKAFREAFKTVSIDFKINRFTIPPLEPYVILANYESTSGVLTEWCNFQGPWSYYYVAMRSLKLTKDKFRVIVPKDIGGGLVPRLECTLT